MVDEEGVYHQIVVHMGKPRRDEGDPYICPFQIEGLGRDQVLYGAGVDEFLALILAIRMMAVTLEYIVSTSNGKLQWEFGDDLDLDLVPRHV